MNTSLPATTQSFTTGLAPQTSGATTGSVTSGVLNSGRITTAVIETEATTGLASDLTSTTSDSSGTTDITTDIEATTGNEQESSSLVLMLSAFVYLVFLLV